MFSFLSAKKISSKIPKRLYGTVVARARDPLFFADFGVPDTVMGRFDMLALHVYLFARRMKKDGSELALSLSQDVFDCFTEDVERALRQLGIGDQSVPKRKKKMIRSFYGQIEDFDSAFERGDMEELGRKAATRYLAENSPMEKGKDVARYMLQVESHLADQSLDAFIKGDMDWPQLTVGLD